MRSAVARPVGGHVSNAGQDPKPHRIAEAIDEAMDCGRIWRDDELAAVFRHQISAPVRCELRGLATETAGEVRLLADAEGLLLKSIGDLLRHPNPPSELLVMVKDFAKGCLRSKEPGIPRDVARAIYYVVIATAMVRCHTRITRLDDAELVAGLEWCRGRPWIDGDTRELVEAGMQFIERKAATA